MRQLHKFGDCHRSQERGFFTETQFAKFANRRDPDNLTNRIFPKPNFSTNTTTTEVVTITAPTRQAFALAKSRSS
jgi:hypothetical protein